MSNRADINFHLLQISDATVAAKAGFDGAKSDRQALVDYAKALGEQLHALNMITTGHDYLDAYADNMVSDINLSFDLAEEERDNNRPISRPRIVGIAYDHSRA